MAGSGRRNLDDPDIGVLAAKLLHAVQQELFAELAARGYADLRPRHGAVLAYLTEDGVRATELARLSGQHKQIIGTIVDELEVLGYIERRADPSDRRAKLVAPTGKGIGELRAADEILAVIEARYAERIGESGYREFKRVFAAMVGHQDV